MAEHDDRVWTLRRSHPFASMLDGPRLDLGEVVEVVPRAENEELRALLAEFADTAEEARGHYGIEETANPGQPATEWDDIQDRLQKLGWRARAVLAGERGDEG